MASARSQVINFLTRIIVRLLLLVRRPIVTIREGLARLDGQRLPHLPNGIRFGDQESPVPGRWVRRDTAGQRTILYLAGGAFVLRLPNAHTTLVAKICAACDADAFMAYYRLAPEHPFPAAPDDCLAAYRYLLAQGIQPSEIVVMGDSAGGNLTLALMHLIAGAGLPMPAAAVALSPITDFVQISASWRLHDWSDPMYRVQGVVNPVEHYLQGADPLDPVASPYYGDLSRFPPTLLLVGGVEALLDDSIGFVRKAIEAGVAARVHIWEGMPHVWPLTAGIPEGPLALARVGQWLDEIADRPQGGLLYRPCVEVFNRRPLTGRLVRETNETFLARAHGR